MSDLEGVACSSDRSRWLINSYTNYLKTGEMFSMERPENCYWMPHFGEAQTWLELIEAVIKLKWGCYKPFMNVLKILFELRAEYAKKKLGGL